MVSTSRSPRSRLATVTAPSLSRPVVSHGSGVFAYVPVSVNNASSLLLSLKFTSLPRSFVPVCVYVFLFHIKGFPETRGNLNPLPMFKKQARKPWPGTLYKWRWPAQGHPAWRAACPVGVWPPQAFATDRSATAPTGLEVPARRPDAGVTAGDDRRGTQHAVLTVWVNKPSVDDASPSLSAKRTVPGVPWRPVPAPGTKPPGLSRGMARGGTVP